MALRRDKALRMLREEFPNAIPNVRGYVQDNCGPNDRREAARHNSEIVLRYFGYLRSERTHPFSKEKGIFLSLLLL